MNKRYKVCPLFWSDYGDERTLMNMGVFEKLLNEGWKILRVDTMPTTELSNNAVTATNVYILEREANDDYDKDMCCLYIAEGMNYIWQQRENQELSRILESLADRKLMKRVHGGYAITLKGLLAVKVWRLHLFLFHHGEYKYFRRKK